MAAQETMDAGDDASSPNGTAAARAAGGGRKKKFIIIGVAVLLFVGGLGGAYVAGLFDSLIGGKTPQAAEARASGWIDLPEIIANLNAGPHRTAFVRLKARLEMDSKPDEATISADTPRIQDLFQTYLRDMRPDELRGSAGTYRLKEELIARANVAIAPTRVTDILFIEMLLQ